MAGRERGRAAAREPAARGPAAAQTPLRKPTRPGTKQPHGGAAQQPPAGGKAGFEWNAIVVEHTGPRPTTPAAPPRAAPPSVATLEPTPTRDAPRPVGLLPGHSGPPAPDQERSPAGAGLSVRLPSAPVAPTPADRPHADSHANDDRAVGWAASQIAGGVIGHLGALAETLRAGALSTRAWAPAARTATSRDAGPPLHPVIRPDGVVTGVGDLARQALTAQRAAAAGGDRRAVADFPVRHEIARLGQGLEVAATYLAVTRAGRRLEALPQPWPGAARAFASQLLARGTALDALLGRISAGGSEQVTAVDSAVGAARVDLSGERGGEDPGARALLDAAQTVGRVGPEAARTLPDPTEPERSAPAAPAGAPDPTRRPPPAKPGDGKAGAGLETLIDRAAGQARELPADLAPAAPSASAPAHLAPTPPVAQAAGPEQPPPNHQTDARSERPPGWEYVVPPGAKEVTSLAIAQTLALARAADLRDVLRQSLETRRQFVIWLGPGVKLASDVQALVSAGLVETRQRS